MKNLFQKLLVLFVTAFMLFTNSVTAFADINRASDSKDLTISGLDAGDTVELYQIYNATYSDDGKTVNSYQFINGVVDGGQKVTIAPGVEVAVADLPKDANGKINVTDADGVTVGATTYKTGDTDVDLTAAKAFNGKFPFTVSGTGTNVGPTESQILAISADIAKNPTAYASARKPIYANGTPAPSYTVDSSTFTVKAYAKAAPATGDAPLSIYDATGIYVARITPGANSDVIYNPLVLSAGYSKDGETVVFDTAGVNLPANYTYAGSKGTAKKSTPSVDKSVTGGFVETGNKPIVACEKDHKSPLNYSYNASAANLPDDALTYILAGKTQADVDAALALTDATARANALAACTTKNVEEAATANSTGNIHSGALGSLFDYTITPTIPNYPENAVNKTLWFADSMGKGLDYVEGSLKVKVGASEYATKSWNSAASVYEFTYGGKLIAKAKEENNGFKINYVYDNLPSAVIPSGLKMEYQAVLNDEAFVGLPGNPNVATMIYSNNPDKGSTHTDLTKPTGEGLKEIEDEEIIYTYEIKFLKTGENSQPLAGAIFGLYAKTAIVDSNNDQLYAAGDLVCTIETNSQGLGYSTLAAPGSYYLQEIKAPGDYQLNSNKYDVPVVGWTSATKKFSVTRESWEYTTTRPTQTTPYDYTKQVGWLVGDATIGEFYQLADFPLTTWTYDATNHTLTNGSQVINNVWEAYIDPAKHVKARTLTEETVTRTDKTGLGWVEVTDAIPNTKTPALPSTGGIGTYLFTIAGVAILATAAFMLIFRKKETH